MEVQEAMQSFLDLTASTTYTITVGAGGGSGDQYAQNSFKINQNGGTSSFAGSGITTLTGNGGSGEQVHTQIVAVLIVLLEVLEVLQVEETCLMLQGCWRNCYL